MSKVISATEKWSRYWQGDRVAACMADAAGSYGDQLGADWCDWFARLPKHARIVDLATGNGALVHLALRSSRVHALQFRIIGVDYADIHPWEHLPESYHNDASISFHGATNIEHLPFAADMFQAVVSQYGAEYADLNKTIAETCRVLAPAGVMRWVCHHQQSSIYANTVREIGHAHFLLEQARPSKHLERLMHRQIQAGRFIENSHQATAMTPERQAMTRSLQACMLRQRQSEPPSDLLDMVMQNLAYLYQHREQHAPELVLEKVAEAHLEIELYLGRMQALADHALDATSTQAISQQLLALGMQNTQTAYVRKRNGNILGIAIESFKPSKL